MDRPYRIIFIVCAVITVGAGVLRRPDVDEDLTEHLPEQATGRGFTTSVTCQACHPAQYDAWHRSYHRTMTQVATPSTVLGTFDDIVLEDRGFRYQFVRRDDEIWVEMPDPLWFENPPGVESRSVREMSWTSTGRCSATRRIPKIHCCWKG